MLKNKTNKIYMRLATMLVFFSLLITNNSLHNSVHASTSDDEVSHNFTSGKGTEENPYIITNSQELDNVRNYLNSHFKLANDIEFTEFDF